MTAREIWIGGNQPFRKGEWHLGRERELRGEKTGTVMSRYFVTACSGRTLGGAWGYTKLEAMPAASACCNRCLSMKESNR